MALTAGPHRVSMCSMTVIMREPTMDQELSVRHWIPGLLCPLLLAVAVPSAAQAATLEVGAERGVPGPAVESSAPHAAASKTAETGAGASAGAGNWGAATTPFDQAGAANADRFEEQDPWEGFNRAIFSFNRTFDNWVLKPAAKSYRWVTPQWADDTVTRVFGNVGDLGNGINSILQWRWGKAGDSFARFLINSTLGLAGLFDVASDLGIAKHRTSLDMTLATWGVHAGPYLVLPILGPSSVRGASALYPSSYLWLPSYIEDSKVRLGVAALYGVDLRADLLDLEKSIIGDRYTFIRSVYLQRHVFSVRDDGGLPPLPNRELPDSEEGW